jgi:hypothetical protein
MKIEFEKNGKDFDDQRKKNEELERIHNDLISENDKLKVVKDKSDKDYED